MLNIRKRSVTAPPRRVGRLAFEASRRAEAMGIIKPRLEPHGNLETIREIAKQLGRAGIATATTTALPRAPSHASRVPVA